MTEFGVFIVLAVFFILGCIVSNYNVTAPSVLTPLIWIAMLSFSHIFKHDLPPLTAQFYNGITIWVTTFCFASMLMQSLKYNQTIHRASSVAIDIYFIISVFSIITLFIFAITAILKIDMDLPVTTKLRMAAVGNIPQYGYSKPYATIFALFWQVSYYFELYYYNSRRKARLLISIFIYFVMAVVLVSKAIIMQFFIITCAILLVKRVIRIKHILYGLVILAVSFIIFHFLRESDNLSGKAINDFFVLYTIGHMYAFDTLQAGSAAHFGENTFRLLYAIANSLNITSIPPVNQILPFIDKPLITNTYTTLYPFFTDFGNKGIAIFGALLGALYGYLFKKQLYKSPLMVILYAYCINIIVMQYVAEMTFTLLAGHIKFLIIVSIPFLLPQKKGDTN